jgi:hypothetical protein
VIKENQFGDRKTQHTNLHLPHKTKVAIGGELRSRGTYSTFRAELQTNRVSTMQRSIARPQIGVHTRMERTSEDGLTEEEAH